MVVGSLLFLHQAHLPTPLCWTRQQSHRRRERERKRIPMPPNRRSEQPVHSKSLSVKINTHYLPQVFKKKCPQNILDRVERVMSQRYVPPFTHRVIYSRANIGSLWSIDDERAKSLGKSSASSVQLEMYVSFNHILEIRLSNQYFTGIHRHYR
jgi:hypothetical protein